MRRTLALLFVVYFCAVAHGQTTLKTTVGWGDALKLGRWTPIFITVADPRARSIDLQIHATHGDSAAMLVSQTAVAQAQPTIYALLFPIDADPTHAIAILSDSQSGATLLKPDGLRAIQLLQDPTAFSPAGHTPIRILGADEMLIGLSGNIGDAAMVQAQLAKINLPSGILMQQMLPASSVGYEGINVLILAATDLRNLEGEQSGAIVDWIRRGGNLVLIPGVEPVAEHSILEGLLPCRIAENRTLILPASAAATQPSQLNGRELIPRSGATPMYPFGDKNTPDGWIGYTKPLGLGRITVLPANISSLQFGNNAQARTFWRTILAGMIRVPEPRSVTSMDVSVEQEDIIPVGPKQTDSVGRGPRETFAIRHMLGEMDAAQARLIGDWRSMLWVLAGLCALLGPLDSILLMYMGQPPRNWLTLLGWIGLLAACAGLIVKRPAADVPNIATLRIIDQADGLPIAATDLVAIESNRDRRMPMALDEHGWWEPANQAAVTFPKDRFLDMNFHQDLHGCFPRVLNLTAGEAQSLRGETSVAGSALLDGDLVLKLDASGATHITGTLTNHSSVPMTDIQIATSHGDCRLAQPVLAAGATMQIDEALSSQPILMTDLPPDVLDISSDRQDRVTALTQQGQACVYCQMPDAPAVNVVAGEDTAKHWQILRAVIPLDR